MRALVVDDSRAMRTVLANILRERGFQVYPAQHGAEALEYLARDRELSLVTVDWRMPVMNGGRMIEWMQPDLQLRQLSLVLVASESELFDIPEGIHARAAGCLTKPFCRNVVGRQLDLMGFSPRTRSGPAGD